MNKKLTTIGRIPILLGKQQAETGQDILTRKLTEIAGVPKDFIYWIDAGTARHFDLDAPARLYTALKYQPQDLLVWESRYAKSI